MTVAHHTFSYLHNLLTLTLCLLILPSSSLLLDTRKTPTLPCGVPRFGDPDLTTYDIISGFDFDEYLQGHSPQEHYVKRVMGSTPYQLAYRLNENYNYSTEITRVFPQGLPLQFSFEVTFRIPRTDIARQPWSLFDVTSEQQESLLRLDILPDQQLMVFFLRLHLINSTLRNPEIVVFPRIGVSFLK